MRRNNLEEPRLKIGKPPRSKRMTKAEQKLTKEESPKEQEEKTGGNTA